MWTILKGKICSFCSCSYFRLGFGCSTRSFQANNEVQFCSSHGWSGGPYIWQCKPHHCEPVDMRVVGNPCISTLISFLSKVLKVGRDWHGSWFQFCWKWTFVLILFPFWRIKCAIAWMLIYKWLLQCIHINSSHLIPFHMKLPMICGQMCRHEIVKANMLKLWNYFQL